MKKTFLLYLAAFLFCLSTSGIVHAQIFVDFGPGGIKGSSQNRDFKDWVEANTFDYQIGNQQAPTGTRSRRGAPVFSNVILTKTFDRATVPLLKHVTIGQSIPEVKINLVRSSERGFQTYFEVKLGKVNVVNHALHGESQGPMSETFELAFETIEYTGYDENGRVMDTPFKWNTSTNSSN